MWLTVCTVKLVYLPLSNFYDLASQGQQTKKLKKLNIGIMLGKLIIG